MTENNETQKDQPIDFQSPQKIESESPKEPVDGVVEESGKQVVTIENSHIKKQISDQEPTSDEPIENGFLTEAYLKKIPISDSLLYSVSNQRTYEKGFSNSEHLITSAIGDRVEDRGSQIIIEEGSIVPATAVEIEMSGLISSSQFEESVNPGVSGGVGASIPVSKRISFITGIYISNQSLKIDDNGSTISFESAKGEVQEEVYANIFALDVPLNLRYYFRQKGKTQTYISTGLSSLTYLKETYLTETSTIKEDITQESEGTVITRKYIEQKNTSSSLAPFSNFDIAALLNVSFGFRYDLKESYDLTIEPYIKYPLTSLTGQEVRIGSGGIKVVLNFTNQKTRSQK